MPGLKRHQKTTQKGIKAAKQLTTQLKLLITNLVKKRQTLDNEYSIKAA